MLPNIPIKTHAHTITDIARCYIGNQFTYTTTIHYYCSNVLMKHRRESELQIETKVEAEEEMGKEGSGRG